VFSSRQVLMKFIVSALALLAPLAGHTQTFPTKPIVIKVAYPAGGPADVAIRDYTPSLPQQLGQPAVVEMLFDRSQSRSQPAHADRKRTDHPLKVAA